MYLICAFRNPFEAESEKWQNSYQLSIGGVRKWVKKSYGLDISKSSVCSVRDKCGADKLEPSAAKIVPKLKSKKELAVLSGHIGINLVRRSMTYLWNIHKWINNEKTTIVILQLMPNNRKLYSQTTEKIIAK